MKTRIRNLLSVAGLVAIAPVAAAQTAWVDWTSVGPSTPGRQTVVGSVGSVNVTLDGELFPGAQVSGGTNYWSAGAATYTSQIVENPPATSDIIQISGGSATSVYVLHFDQPVRDPVMAVLSLGNSAQSAFLNFANPFVIENSGAGHFGNGPLTTQSGTVLVGQEGNGVIRFPGEHTDIVFSAPDYEFWYGFTIGWPGVIGQARCSPAVPNSTGHSGTLTAVGSPVAVRNQLVVAASLLPPDTFGYFLNSQTAGHVPNAGGSQGTLCLGGAVGRYDVLVQSSGLSGSFLIALDLTRTPTPGGYVAVVAGETWRFQAWYRDAVSGTPTSNFTDAVSILFL